MRLSLTPTPDSQLDFLIQVLDATYDSQGNPQIVYPLLQANLDLLNDDFATVLQSWARRIPPEIKSEQAQFITAAIFYFSKLIQEFPQGNRANNQEIAIAGYEIAQMICTRDAFPENWADTQSNLGNAYFEKIRGERAENLEQASRKYRTSDRSVQTGTRCLYPQHLPRTMGNYAK